MEEKDAVNLFKRWYEVPLKELEKIPNGDGGLVVLGSACFLYERYASALIDERGDKVTEDAKIDQMAADFGVDKDTAEVFWRTVRHGMLHQGMPLMQTRSGKPVAGWETTSDYPAMGTEDHGGNIVLKLQPWKFRDRVLQLWDSRPDLIAKSQSFPWASIYMKRV